MFYGLRLWDDFNAMNLLYGALVTIILTIALYLYPIQQTIQHRSVILWVAFLLLNL